MSKVFKQVVTDLLGWDLDPAEECVGRDMLLLGLDLEIRADCSEWRLGRRKREEWAQAIRRALRTDCLMPGPEWTNLQPTRPGASAAFDLASATDTCWFEAHPTFAFRFELVLEGAGGWFY